MMKQKLTLLSILVALVVLLGIAPQVQAQTEPMLFNIGPLPENICYINGQAQIDTWYIFGSTMGVGFLNGDGYHQMNTYNLSPLGVKTLQTQYVFIPAKRELCVDYGLNVSIGPVYLSGELHSVPVTPYPEPEVTVTPVMTSTNDLPGGLVQP
jgi:hypothetical protein